MSQELYQLLHERARIGVMGWPLGLALSIAFHGAVVAVILFSPKSAPPPEVTKTTWVTLPALGGAGPAGGASVIEEGKQGERQRRVEEVAPKTPEKAGSVTPNAFGEKPTAAAKGTNPDPTSLGKAPIAAKGPNPTANPRPGAAGSGNGSGIGVGTSFPGLKATRGVSGGAGYVSGIDSNEFPFEWYLIQVQEKVVSNWTVSRTVGNAQIFFRIRRDGSIEGVRVENSSSSADFDENARLAVIRAGTGLSKFPELPEAFQGQTLGVHFGFTYTGN